MRAFLLCVTLLLSCTPLVAWGCSPTGYPGTGQTMLSNFTTGAFRIQFDDDGCTLRIKGLTGGAVGIERTMTYAYTPLGSGIHRLTWVARHEDGTIAANVVHVQNWNTCMVYSSVSEPDMTFLHWQGPQIRNWDGETWSAACPGNTTSPR